jgi:hypothetical protein
MHSRCVLKTGRHPWRAFGERANEQKESEHRNRKPNERPSILPRLSEDESRHQNSQAGLTYKPLAMSLPLCQGGIC